MGFNDMGGINVVLTIFPIIFIAFFTFVVIMIIKSAKRDAADRRAPRVEGRGTAVSKRTQVDGTQSGASTEYFITIETEDGVRTELRSEASLYGIVAEGDRGVFTRQGSRIVGFVRDGSAYAAAPAKAEEDVNGWHRCSACGATFKGERCDYCGTPWNVDK